MFTVDSISRGLLLALAGQHPDFGFDLVIALN